MKEMREERAKSWEADEGEEGERLCQMFLKGLYQWMVSGELNKSHLVEPAQREFMSE